MVFIVTRQFNLRSVHKSKRWNDYEIISEVKYVHTYIQNSYLHNIRKKKLTSKEIS